MSAPGRPLIIASLTARNVTDARQEAEAVRRAGADLAEIRFDRWEPAEVARMAELFPSPIPLIATLRSRAEGGDGPDEATLRAAWVTEVCGRPFSWIDLESARDTAPPTGSPSSPQLILSTHLPRGTPSAEVRRELGIPLPTRSLRKVIVPSSVRMAAIELPSALRLDGAPFVLHTTGASGPLLRAWSRRLGMSAVYGAPPALARRGAPPVEASQVPVDRLRRFLEGQGNAPLFAVVGRPISHSRSPDLHHHWMAQLQQGGLYLALEIESDEELGEVIEPLARGGFRGMNVTHPFKDAALRLSTDRTESAGLCGCANTLTFDKGRVEADNTDLVAMRRRLAELRGSGAWDGRSALVVGSGGAARAALSACRTVGAQAQVLARNALSAQSVARAFGAAIATETPNEPAQLVINATPVGRGTATLEVPLGPWLAAGTYLLDYVYAPDRPTLAEQVRAVGGTYEDGARLLAYSAAASFARWWGIQPGADAIESGLREIGA